MIRDPKTGHFLPGNPGGPGRGRRSKEEQYLRALTMRVTLDDWGAIIDQAVADAKDGDDRARRWLSDYLIGRPTEYVQADVTTGGESLNANWKGELDRRLAGIIAGLGAEEVPGEPEQ